MWFKNLMVYRLTNWSLSSTELEQKLAERALQPCGGLDAQRMGWVAPRPDGSTLVHEQGPQLLISLGMEKKLLPSSVVNQFAAQRAQDVEAQQGYKPGRKQMKEIKEAVTDELLPRAFVIRSQTYAWLDTRHGWLVIDAASVGKADDLLEMLIKSVEDIAIEPLRTNVTPVSAMTSWLSGEELPAVFTVDRDCELRGSGEEKATVRYVRHSLETDEIARHIGEGKEVTKLAMSWADKLSFVLHENWQIKRLAPLDVLKDQAEGSDADELFDADFVIMTGELQRLLPELIELLDGEVKTGIPG